MKTAEKNIVNESARSSLPRRAVVRKCRARSGTSVLEMAISFTVLLYMSFGMVEFGQFFYIRHAFASAVRDGCRVAILPTATLTTVQTAIGNTLSQAGIKNYTTNYESWLTQKVSTDLGTTYVTVSDSTTYTQGTLLQFTLSTNYETVPNALRPLYATTGQGIKNGKAVTAQVTMVKE